jgi:hypothetical protein
MQTKKQSIESVSKNVEIVSVSNNELIITVDGTKEVMPITSKKDALSTIGLYPQLDKYIVMACYIVSIYDLLSSANPSNLKPQDSKYFIVGTPKDAIYDIGERILLTGGHESLQYIPYSDNKYTGEVVIDHIKEYYPNLVTSISAGLNATKAKVGLHNVKKVAINNRYAAMIDERLHDSKGKNVLSSFDKLDDTITIISFWLTSYASFGCTYDDTFTK